MLTLSPMHRFAGKKAACGRSDLVLTNLSVCGIIAVERITMMIKISTACLSLLLLTFTAFAQQKTSTKFTSVYTNLNKDCKILRGKNGTDDASVCKGGPGYQVRLYYSAASSHINAELKGTDESVSLATLSVGFDESKTTLEWRLANGKPFAVILRVPEYSEETAPGEYFGKVIGQKLMVVGLSDYNKSNSSIDAKIPDANAKAREIADAGYKPMPPEYRTPKIKKDRPF
jgi:hypothetical protein